MNILFITDLYPVKDTETTTPKTLLNFTKEWEKQGHTVKVIKPNFILNSFLRGKPFYKTGQYGNVYNVNYWTPFLGSGKLKVESGKLEEQTARGQEGKPLTVESGKSDNSQFSTFNFQLDNSSPSYTSDFHTSVVIAHMPSGILFADKLGLPFVAGIHNSDLTVLTSPLYAFHFRKRMIRALKNAKAIACRSFVIKNKLLKIFPEFENKTFVAPSGIDEKIINDTNYSPLTTHSSPLKILTCAHFKKRKNIDKLIKACKNIDDIELTVIGDGKIRKSLEKLDKNVIFTGELEQEQVYEKMRESDVFILPSTDETFGMVYLEAMASGCITVCTKNDGIDGIIKDGENGFLTEPDVENIKDTILKIKTLPPETIETIKQNTLETVKEYTSSKVAENYLKEILKIF
ncbi:glycosyltransferase family 4 protein [bacterium]|nr:glycosyltransferase family 4 protein [bacterium]